MCVTVGCGVILCMAAARSEVLLLGSSIVGGLVAIGWVLVMALAIGESAAHCHCAAASCFSLKIAHALAGWKKACCVRVSLRSVHCGVEIIVCTRCWHHHITGWLVRVGGALL